MQEAAPKKAVLIMARQCICYLQVQNKVYMLQACIDHVSVQECQYQHLHRVQVGSLLQSSYCTANATGVSNPCACNTVPVLQCVPCSWG